MWSFTKILICSLILLIIAPSTVFSQRTDSIKFHCYTRVQNKLIEKQFFLVADLQQEISTAKKISEDQRLQIIMRNQQLSADSVIQNNLNQKFEIEQKENSDLVDKLNKAQRMILTQKVEKYSIAGISLAMIGYLLFTHR